MSGKQAKLARKSSEQKLSPIGPARPDLGPRRGDSMLEDLVREMNAGRWVGKVDSRPALVQLRDIAAGRRAARAAELELVGRLRAEGVSWSEIGAALGMSGQGARQRSLVVES